MRKLLPFAAAAALLAGCSTGLDLTFDALGNVSARMTMSVQKGALFDVNTLDDWKAIIASASSAGGDEATPTLNLPAGVNCASSESGDKTAWTYGCDLPLPGNELNAATDDPESQSSTSFISRIGDTVQYSFSGSALSGLGAPTGDLGSMIPGGSANLLSAMARVTMSVTMVNATLTAASQGVSGIGTSTASFSTSSLPAGGLASFTFKLAQAPQATASSVTVFQTASTKSGCTLDLRSLSKHSGTVTVTNSAKSIIAQGDITREKISRSVAASLSGSGDCTKALTATFYPADFMHVNQSSSLPVLGPATLPVSGKFQTGSTLTMSGKWSNASIGSYQWQRDGKAITGANKATYKVSAADKGHKLAVTATLTRGDGVKVSMLGNAVKVTK